jgi:hypothetical protein
LEIAAPHQALRNAGRLKRRSFGRRMSRKITGDRNQDMPGLVRVAPYGDLPDSRLQRGANDRL